MEQDFCKSPLMVSVGSLQPCLLLDLSRSVWTGVIKAGMSYSLFPGQAEAAGEPCAIIFLSLPALIQVGVDGGWGNSKVPQGRRSVLAEITSTELPGHEHVVFTLPV